MPEMTCRAKESTTFFTWNAEEITVTGRAGDEETERKQWVSDRVEVDGEPTFDKVFLKVIREKYSESEEFALVNAYNAHVTGIKEDEVKVEEYKAMLQWRQEKKEELKALFASHNP